MTNGALHFEREFSETYPHGAHGISCTTIWNDHVVTAARRDVKVWRQQDADEENSDDERQALDLEAKFPTAKRPKTCASFKPKNKKNWKVSKKIHMPDWNEGGFLSIGGPHAMCAFARGSVQGDDDLLVVGDANGNIDIFCWLEDDEDDCDYWDDDWEDSQIQSFPYEDPETKQTCLDDVLELYMTEENDEKHVTSIVQLDDKSFVASHLDGTIFQFALYGNKGRSKKTIPELFSRTDWAPENPHRNTGVLTLLAISDSRLASGAEDNAIHVWNIEKLTIEMAICQDANGLVCTRLTQIRDLSRIWHSLEVTDSCQYMIYDWNLAATKIFYMFGIWKKDKKRNMWMLRIAVNWATRRMLARLRDLLSLTTRYRHKMAKCGIQNLGNTKRLKALTNSLQGIAPFLAI